MTPRRPMAIVPTLKPFPATPDCPKCGRRTWGITWHKEVATDEEVMCRRSWKFGDVGPKEEHLHWTCPCGYLDLTSIKRRGEME